MPDTLPGTPWHTLSQSGIFQANTLVKAFSSPTDLLSFVPDFWYGRPQIPAEGRLCAWIITPLRFTPVSPSLKQFIARHTKIWTDEAPILNKCRSRATQVFEFTHGLSCTLGLEEMATLLETNPPVNRPIKNARQLFQKTIR